MTSPVAAHAEEPAATQTLQYPSLHEEVTVDGSVDGSSTYERRAVVGVIAVDGGGGCTQYFIFYSDGSVRTAVRCVVIIQGLHEHLARGTDKRSVPRAGFVLAPKAPLYAPYNPDGPTEPNEQGVIRDLNNAWSARCREWLAIGLEILDDAHIASSHRSSRDALGQFIESRAGDPSAAANLILDALTVHDPELDRIARTL